MSTILSNIRPGHIDEYPYVWGEWGSVLDNRYYEKLMAAYPTLEQVVGNRKWEQNARYDIDAVDLLKRDDIDPLMKEFIDLHTSNLFWQKIVDVFGDHIRATYPDLEAQLGKSLDEFIVGVRNDRRVEPYVEGDDITEPMEIIHVDVELDAKPGYNTPTKLYSSVRGQHVDNPKELFAAIMYCRLPEDVSHGGDFIIDEPTIHPDRWQWHGKNELSRQHFNNYGCCPYGRNVGVVLINSLRSVHHVTNRQITPYPRRLMNFIAEVRSPLFKIPKERYPAP